MIFGDLRIIREIIKRGRLLHGKPEMINPASVNLCLGNTFLTPCKIAGGIKLGDRLLPLVCACKSVYVRPLPMSIVASVVTKGGMPKYAMKNPANTPVSIPTASAAMIATHMFILRSIMMIPANDPVTATTDPTPRSMLPVSTHSSIPIARMTT